MTLGQIIRGIKGRVSAVAEEINELEALPSAALEARNRLQHSFYREHNLRRNSEEGRAIMLADLESIHTTILVAYKKTVKILSGIDLEDPSFQPVELATWHLPI